MTVEENVINIAIDIVGAFNAEENYLEKENERRKQ